MRSDYNICFDGVIGKLSGAFESNPYSLSSSELEILKWFSKNPGYLEKPKKQTVDSLIRTDLVVGFIKKNINND